MAAGLAVALFDLLGRALFGFLNRLIRFLATAFFAHGPLL